MKITGYTQQITNVSGSSSSAPKLDASAQVKATKSEALDFTPIANGIGKWEDAIKSVYEQEDKEKILSAMDSYNKGMDSVLNDQENGLLNTKEQGAIGITDKFASQASELQNTIVGDTKLHFKANQLALDKFFNTSSLQSFEQVRNHQTQQMDKLQLTHLTNIANDMNLDGSKHYNSPQYLEGCKNKLGIAVDLMYSKYGPEKVEVEKRKYFGTFGTTVLQAAITNNDLTAQQQIYAAYGDYMPEQTRNNFEKLSIQKQTDQWVKGAADALFSKYSSVTEALAHVGEYKTRTYQGFGGSTLVDQFRDRIGKEAYYLDGIEGSNNTGCAKAITKLPGLKGTEYAGVTWVPKLMDIAKKNGEWHDGTDGIQPGDLIITHGDGHVSMWTGTGEIQNGESGHNNVGSAGGKGGVHESEGMPSDVTGYISMTKYNQSAGEARTVDVSDDDMQTLRNAIIRKYREQATLKSMEIAQYGKNLEQEVFTFKRDNPNATADDALQKFANMGSFSDGQQYTAAVQAVARWYPGVKLEDSSGASSPKTGKGDPVAFYDVKKMIEAGAFDKDGVPDTIKFRSYLFSDKCSDVTQSNKEKLLETFDDYQNKTGAYKYNWSEIDDRILNGIKVNSAVKEEMLAAGEAHALELIKTWNPKEHQGRTSPTQEEIIEAGREGMNNTFKTFVQEKGKFWGTNTKTFEIRQGTLDKAGYPGGMEDSGDNMVALYRDKAQTDALVISKDVLIAMFPNITLK